ncbi:MAG TPA: hypothetical protein VF432_33495 [Thermoanaerobaculia bacterium]
MVRILPLILLALAPFARAYPAERPISHPRVGVPAETSPFSMKGAAGDGRFLVVWASIGRGAQAAVLDLTGNPLGDTSIALPLLYPEAVFWHDGAWTVVGSAVGGRGWVRLNRDGALLDSVARPIESPGDLTAAVWTGSSLVVAGRTTLGVHVVTYDADLKRLATRDLETQSFPGLLRLATDGETALVAYVENAGPEPRPMNVALFGADGSLLKTRQIVQTGRRLTALGSPGDGRGYFVVTAASPADNALFAGFLLDHNLDRRSIPGGFGRPERLYAWSETLAWNGSALVFFYVCDGDMTTEVRAARFSATGSILEDGVVTTDSATFRIHDGFEGVGGMGTTLMLFLRSATSAYDDEPQFLRVRAGHDAASLSASPEVELERGALEQIRPAAASGATQSLVAWRERNSVPAPHRVYAARVDGEGNVRDPQSLLLGTTSCEQARPSVATNGDSFLVTWYDDAGVMAARIGADGSVVNTRIQHFREQPCVESEAKALSNGTDYLVVWRRSGESEDPVLAARVAASGTLIDTVPIELGEAASMVSGASNGTDYLLAWDGRMIRVAANGTRLDAKIEASGGKRVAGDGTLAVWWNGTAYSLVQYQPRGFSYEYQLARVTPDGGVTKVGSPEAWPALQPSWGGGDYTCHGAGCTAVYGTIEEGGYFLRPVDVADDGVLPFFRVRDAAPIAPPILRDPDERADIVPFGVPGGRRFVAFTRYSLEHPYSGISRVFIRPLTVVRGRAVRH